MAKLLIRRLPDWTNGQEDGHLMIIKVEAIIREEKLQDVLDALGDMEVHGITCYQVMGWARSVG